MATVPQIIASLEASADRADTSSEQMYDVANGPATGPGSTVATDSGSVPTIAKWFADNQVNIDAQANLEGRLKLPSGSAISGYTLGVAGAIARTAELKLRERVSVKDFGAIGDGASHPLNTVTLLGGVNTTGWTLAQWQTVYPHAQAVTDQLDWCAIQAALNYISPTGFNATTGGGEVFVPGGRYLTNRTLLVGWATVLKGTGIGGFPYQGVNSKQSIIVADFGTSVNQWAIDSATYKKPSGVRVAYNEFVDSTIDASYNSLHQVGVVGLYVESANVTTQIVWGGVRLVGCPSAKLDIVSYGFGIAWQLNTCFGAEVRVQSESIYYGGVAFESANSVKIDGYMNRMISPTNATTVPSDRILSFIPDATSLTSVFQLSATHANTPKGLVVGAMAGSSSQAPEIGVTLEYWQDTVFLLRAYGILFTRLYCESTAIQFVLSGAYCSAKVLTTSIFAANAKVMDVGFDCSFDFNSMGLNANNGLFNSVSNDASTDNRTDVIVRGLSAQGQIQYPRVSWERDSKPIAIVSFSGVDLSIKKGYNIAAVSRVPGEAVGDYWIDFNRAAGAVAVRGEVVAEAHLSSNTAGLAYTPQGGGDGIQNTRIRVRCITMAGAAFNPDRVMVAIYG